MVMDDRRRQQQARVEFERFVEASVDRLLRSAYLITWDLAEAEDLVQECLLRVARRWPRVRKMDHPTAYARTVLVHLALDEGKHRTRRRAELAEAATLRLDQHQDDAALRVLGRVEASADLLQALAELPPRQRVALVLRYFEDLSEADAAEAMGCSVGTVKSTTSRALGRLRAIVDAPPSPKEVSDNHSGDGPAISIPVHLDAQKEPCVVSQDVRTNEGSVTP